MGELTNLLIPDVDLKEGKLEIRSKPFLQWHVKTNQEKCLPIIPQVLDMFEQAIGDRKEGFVFFLGYIGKGSERT